MLYYYDYNYYFFKNISKHLLFQIVYIIEWLRYYISLLIFILCIGHHYNNSSTIPKKNCIYNILFYKTSKLLWKDQFIVVNKIQFLLYDQHKWPEGISEQLLYYLFLLYWSVRLY